MEEKWRKMHPILYQKIIGYSRNNQKSSEINEFDQQMKRVFDQIEKKSYVSNYRFPKRNYQKIQQTDNDEDLIQKLSQKVYNLYDQNTESPCLRLSTTSNKSYSSQLCKRETSKSKTSFVVKTKKSKFAKDTNQQQSILKKVKLQSTYMPIETSPNVPEDQQNQSQLLKDKRTRFSSSRATVNKNIALKKNLSDKQNSNINRTNMINSFSQNNCPNKEKLQKIFDKTITNVQQKTNSNVYKRNKRNVTQLP